MRLLFIAMALTVSLSVQAQDFDIYDIHEVGIGTEYADNLKLNELTGSIVFDRNNLIVSIATRGTSTQHKIIETKIEDNGDAKVETFNGENVILKLVKNNAHNGYRAVLQNHGDSEYVMFFLTKRSENVELYKINYQHSGNLNKSMDEERSKPIDGEILVNYISGLVSIKTGSTGTEFKITKSHFDDNDGTVVLYLAGTGALLSIRKYLDGSYDIVLASSTTNDYIRFETEKL